MKRVLLTGHTKGLGAAIYKELEADHIVIGASRSTNMHVMEIDPFDYEHFDVLINNAYHSIGQIELLRTFYDMWQGKDKVIINVGTAGLGLSNRPFETLNYNAAKRQLETYSRWISDNDEFCKCMLFSPGYMDTELVRSRSMHWDEDAQKKNTSKPLDVSYCAKIIRLMIESPHRIRDLQLIP